MILTTVVGAFLLLTAVLKAFYSRLFIIHIKRFKLIPEGPSALAALLFIELEAGLGTALMLRVYPAITIPLVFCLLVMFTAITIWGYRFRKLAECGCYGGVVLLKPNHSLLLNLVLIGITGYDWLEPSPPLAANIDNLYIVVVVVLVIHLVAKNTVQRPIIDLLGLKSGRKLNSRFEFVANSNHDDITIYVVLQGNCSQCRVWLQKIKELQPSEIQNRIMILISQKDRASYPDWKDQYGQIKFNDLKDWKVRLLTGRLPMAMRVEYGVIEAMHTGTFPDEEFFI